MPTETTLHSFASLEESWDALVPDCDVKAFFLSHDWQRLWWESFGEGRELLLLAFQQASETVGIAPMQRQDDVISFLGDTDLFDFHDFIIPQGKEASFYPVLEDYLTSQPWQKLYFPSLSQASPTLEYLPQMAERQGWQCLVEQEDVSPTLTLPVDWDTYLSELRKKDRHELRRKFRRLEAADGFEPKVYTDPGDVAEKLDYFFDLMRQSREEKHRFLTPEREAFFREMAVALAEVGVLGLWFLEQNGTPVSSALCFDYCGRRLLYNSGFDPEYADLSVGLLLKATCIRDAIERKLTSFEFLRGDEPYKYHLGGVDQAVYCMTVSRSA
jgi:CelD/BcsL family acetyltransferase involved in cellulose biosynthesis